MREAIALHHELQQIYYDMQWTRYGMGLLTAGEVRRLLVVVAGYRRTGQAFTAFGDCIECCRDLVLLFYDWLRVLFPVFFVSRVGGGVVRACLVALGSRLGGVGLCGCLCVGTCL